MMLPTAQLRPMQGAVGTGYHDAVPLAATGAQHQRVPSNGANIFQGPPHGVVLHPIGHGAPGGQQPMINRVLSGNPNAGGGTFPMAAMPVQLQQNQQIATQLQRLPPPQQQQQQMLQVMPQSGQPLNQLHPVGQQARPAVANTTTAPQAIQAGLSSPVRQPLTISGGNSSAMPSPQRNASEIKSPQRNANNMTSSLHMDQTASTLSPLTPAPLALTTPSKPSASSVQQTQQAGPPPHSQPAPPPIRDRVVHFYKKYNEAKLASVDDILKAYAGHEEDLMSALVNKYGPEETWWDPLHPHHSSSLHLHQRTLSQGASGQRSGHLNPSAAAGSSTNLPAMKQIPLTFEQRLAHLFQLYDPSRLVQIPQLLQSFRGNEETLINTLTQRYSGGNSSKEPTAKPLNEAQIPPSNSHAAASAPPEKSALKHFDSRFADIAIHDSDGDSDDGTPQAAARATNVSDAKRSPEVAGSKRSPELPKPSPRSKSLSPIKTTSPEQAKKSAQSSRHVSPLQPALPPLSSHLVQHRPPALEDAALASGHDIGPSDPSLHPTPRAAPSAHHTPAQSPNAVTKAETPQTQLLLPRTTSPINNATSSGRAIASSSQSTPLNTSSGRLVVSSSVRVARSPPRNDENAQQSASSLAHSIGYEAKDIAGRPSVTRNLDQSFAKNSSKLNQSTDHALSFQRGKERSVSVSTASRSPSQQELAPRLAEELQSENVGSDVPARSRSASGLSAPPPLSLAAKKSSRLLDTSVSQPLWVNPSAKGALSLAYERSKQEARQSSSLNASQVERLYPSRKGSAMSSAATSPQKELASAAHRNSDVKALNRSSRADQVVTEMMERRTSSAAATPRRTDSCTTPPVRNGSSKIEVASRCGENSIDAIERRASSSSLRSHSADALGHKRVSTVQPPSHSDRQCEPPSHRSDSRLQSPHVVRRDSKTTSLVDEPHSAMQPNHVDPQVARSQPQVKATSDAVPAHRRSRSANPDDPIYREIGRQSTFAQDIDVVVVDLRTAFKPNIRNPPPPENLSGIKPLGAIKQSPHKRTVSPSRVSRSNTSEVHDGVEHNPDASVHDSTPKRKIIVVEHAPKDLPFELYSSFRDAAKKPSVPMSAWAKAPVKPTSLDTSPLRRKVILGNASQNAPTEGRTKNNGHKELIRFDERGRMIKLIPDAPADPEAVEAQRKLCHRLSLPKPIYVRKEDNV